MKYTFDEFKQLREQHNKDLNVQCLLPSKDLDKTVKYIEDSMINNPDMTVFTLTRPIVTLDTFKVDLNLFNHLYRNCKDMIFTFLPEMGYFAFFRTTNDKQKFDNNNLWKNKEMRDYQSVKLYTSGAELIHADGTKDYVIFDEIG